jgi:hypothetical protein
MLPNRRRWREVAGLDFHVLVTLLFRGWAVIAGGATVLLLPLWLSPTAQGYYFTFASLLTVQVFFELGLNQIVVQLVSHEMAHLTNTADGRLTGEELHLSRLSSLAKMLRRWYVAAALMFALVGAIVGTVFFSQRGTEPASQWLGAWLVLVVATAVNLWRSPGLAVMEGCGRVGQVARLRLVQSVLGYASLWLALLAGAGLWAATAVPIVSAVCTNYWLKSQGSMLYWLSGRSMDVQHQLHWRQDVFPLQWRIALSWISGYLIFNLFTPVVFSRQGPVEAGRLGMALTVFSAISIVGMSWVNAKAPDFTMHIARGERRELDTLFKSLFVRSTSVIALASIGLVLVAWFYNQRGSSLIMRLAAPEILGLLAVITIVNSMVFAMAVYMRAHREEPMLVQSVFVGLLMACVVYWDPTISVFTMMLAYLLITLLIGFPWTLWLFTRYIKRSS